MRQAGQHAERDTRTEPAEDDGQVRTVRAGLSGKECQNRTSRTGEPGQLWKGGTGRMGHAEQARTGRTEYYQREPLISYYKSRFWLFAGLAVIITFVLFAGIRMIFL